MPLCRSFTHTLLVQHPFRTGAESRAQARALNERAEEIRRRAFPCRGPALAKRDHLPSKPADLDMTGHVQLARSTELGGAWGLALSVLQAEAKPTSFPMAL